MGTSFAILVWPYFISSSYVVLVEYLKGFLHAQILQTELMFLLILGHLFALKVIVGKC